MSLILMIVAVSIGSLPVSASTPDDFHEVALRAAQRKVDKKNALTLSSAGALSTSMIKSLLGRNYQIGDSWEVAAWRADSSMMRMTDHTDQARGKYSRGGVFRYEVTELRNGAEPKVVLQVTQIRVDGMPIHDQRVERLDLIMTDQFSQTRKEYRFSGIDQPVTVSPDGIRSSITPLELFPLDVPDLFSAERKNARNVLEKLPELPREALTFATKTGFNPDLSRSFWFEQDDFFGRPVQVLWQRGDPWPVYLKTSQGISILIRSLTGGHP